VPRAYRNAPLIEALCEFRFDPASLWDPTIPGLLYGELRTDFPVREPTRAIEATVTSAPGAIQQAVIEVDRLQMYREDRTAVVQLSPHLLVVNQLKPYPGWEAFYPVVQRALRLYRDIAKPTALFQIGLRYINRIQIQGVLADLHQYFDFYPHVGAELLQDSSAFLAGVQTSINNGRDSLRVQLASTVPDVPDTLQILLDIYLTLEKSGALSFDQIDGWLNDSHGTVEQAFEGCIREGLRKQFDEVD